MHTYMTCSLFHEKRNGCARVHALVQVLIHVYTHVYAGALQQGARLYHRPFSVAQAKPSFPHTFSSTYIHVYAPVMHKYMTCSFFHEKRNGCARVHALMQVLIHVYTHVYAGALRQGARLYHWPFSVAQAKHSFPHTFSHTYIQVYARIASAA